MIHPNLIDALLEDCETTPIPSPACEIQKVNSTFLKPLINRSELRQPQYVRQVENHTHRAMVEMAAKGHTAKEIAAATGKTTACVNQILLQPHLQETLVNGIHENFGTDREVVEVIKDSVVKAITFLSETIDNTKALTRDRIAAANMVLERRYGKANQPINQPGSVNLNKLPDEELIAIINSKN
jgi:hypothetical protein